MNAISHSPAATASVTCPELSKTCMTNGSLSDCAKPLSRSTVTPRTTPLPSLMAKKAEAAGETTTPPRSLPVGASCLRSSGFVMGPRLTRGSPACQPRGLNQTIYGRLIGAGQRGAVCRCDHVRRCRVLKRTAQNGRRLAIQTRRLVGFVVGLAGLPWRRAGRRVRVLARPGARGVAGRGADIAVDDGNHDATLPTPGR